METSPKISLTAFDDIRYGMIKRDILRSSKGIYEMLVGDFEENLIHNIDSFHEGTYAELEDLGEHIISSNINTPSYLISSKLNNHIVFRNENCRKKFDGFNSKQFVVKL